MIHRLRMPIPSVWIFVELGKVKYAIGNFVNSGSCTEFSGFLQSVSVFLITRSNDGSQIIVRDPFSRVY